MQDAVGNLVRLRPEPTLDYDTLVVGTSPICLLTALLEQSRGRRVLMVDAAPETGGTWKTTSLLGFSNVELGCHGIDADPGVYGLLTALGVNLQPLSPQPFVFSVGPRLFPRRVSFRHRWLRDLYDVLSGTRNFDLPGAESGRFQALYKSLRRVARYAFMGLRGSNHPSRYPPHGASELVARLTWLAVRAGIEIRTSTLVDDVVLDREAGRVHLRLDGRPLTAGRLHLTSSSNLKPIADTLGEIDLQRLPNVWQSLYLVLRDCAPPPFTYIIFSQEDLLHRASDLTRFAVPGPGRAGARLIALTIDENAPADESTATTALATMKRLGLIDAAARLEAFDFLPYPFTRIDFAHRRDLQRSLAPLVQIIESDTLTRSIKVFLRQNDLRPLLQRVAGLDGGPSPGRGAGATVTALK